MVYTLRRRELVKDRGDPRRNTIRSVAQEEDAPVKALLVALLVLAGAALVVVGIVYFVEPAHALPSFFPGHSRGHKHGVKHGVAAVVVGVVILVIAMLTWPRRARASLHR